MKDGDNDIKKAGQGSSVGVLTVLALAIAVALATAAALLMHDQAQDMAPPSAVNITGRGMTAGLPGSGPAIPVQAVPAAPADAEQEILRGIRCLDTGDNDCAQAAFRNAAVAGRGKPQGEEARHRLIALNAGLKRCTDVMLYLTVFQSESPESPLLAGSFMSYAGCLAATGDRQGATGTYRAIMNRFASMKDAASAEIEKLEQNDGKAR
ncbi:MAG: hypothetical protein WC889_17735 [Myxococcota bacterium]